MNVFLGLVWIYPIVKQLTASHEAREGKQLAAECPGVYAMCRAQKV
jgi:hypothetical protein